MDHDDKDFSHDDMFRRFGRPIRPEGGIKAQSKRGAVAQTWWGKRWIQVLESFNLGARLQRGRSYARRGQVLSIEFKKAYVIAEVQGSHTRPYYCGLYIGVLSPADWHNIIADFAAQALYSAKLLTRQMPPQVEQVFHRHGVSLFPAKKADLKTACNCPDWSNPCKHVAAVYYLLAEEFDRDPFLIFQLRGMSEDQLLLALDSALRTGPEPKEPEKTKDLAATKSGGKRNKRSAEKEPTIIRASSIQRNSSASGDFWKAGDIPREITGSLRKPERDALLARNLGNFPFWRGEEDFWQSLEKVYKGASRHAFRRLNKED